ncbi:MAG: hypothetical protein ABIG20_01355 [archaeon]
MVEAVRRLENELRNIRYACRDAINDDTGAVEVTVIAANANKLRVWINDFEKSYISDAKRRPTRGNEILREGKKLAEAAWFCCELLWNAELEAGGAPPALTRWENLPSGVVVGDIKAEILIELLNLLNDYRNFRRDIVKT